MLGTCREEDVQTLQWLACFACQGLYTICTSIVERCIILHSGLISFQMASV